mmetsp:Transcript_73600/g.204540  ORF Transcript_73600/g.204540 Transcript_73600/m.204540 type:complete len:213 (+) Transcript_73600:1790-2428(+)
MTKNIIAFVFTNCFSLILKVTPRLCQLMSMGLGACFTLILRTGTPPMGYLGSFGPQHRPRQQPSSRYHILLWKLVHLLRHSCASSLYLKTTTAVPDDVKREAMPGALDTSSWLICRMSSVMVFILGSSGASCAFSLRRAFNFRIFSEYSAHSQPITTLTTWVSSLPRTAYCLKKLATSSSDVAVFGKPDTRMAKSFGCVVMASTLALAHIWY